MITPLYYLERYKHYPNRSSGDEQSVLINRL